MAKVLGESGRYVSDQAVAKQQKTWLLSIVVIVVASVMEGAILGRWLFPVQLSPAVSIPFMLALLIAMVWMCRSSSKKIRMLDTERAAMQRGAVGEIGVGYILQKFPDCFHVINDLTTTFGNLDHVVVGPTGVFVIDTKNWRGIVSADGKGELLLNGKPTEKPFIRLFVARMMSVREKVQLLASSRDIFYESVFVFTSAKVEAQWGKTGNVNCIREDQLNDYIVQKDFGGKLDAKEVGRIAQAFLAVANMDKNFDPRPQTAFIPQGLPKQSP
jgi:hypothetical protein